MNGGSDSLLECFCNTLGALLPVFVIQGDKRKGEEDHEIENERIQRNHAEKSLTADQICRSTGLSEFSLNWILDNGGFTSGGTLKALAIAADVALKGIVRPDPSDNVEKWN